MILVDTNIVVVVAYSRDTHHEAARDLETAPELLSERAGPSADARFLRAFGAGELRLAELTLADMARMADLTERYADLGLGGTDASVVAIAERLGSATSTSGGGPESRPVTKGHAAWRPRRTGSEYGSNRTRPACCSARV